MELLAELARASTAAALSTRPSASGRTATFCRYRAERPQMIAATAHARATTARIGLSMWVGIVLTSTLPRGERSRGTSTDPASE